MHTAHSRLALTALSIRHLLGWSLIVLAITLIITSTPQAQTRETAIIVNTFDDELDDGGNDCSLREAIEAASTDSSVDGCPAGNGDDAILLPAGTYALQIPGADEDANGTGDLDIVAGTVMLMGTGPERTLIDGNHLDRVLHIHSGTTVEIHGIQITNGKTPDGYPGGVRIWGGGIRNDGTLLLSHSTVISNTTGEGREAYVDGGHGGGIYNSGVLTLEYTTVVDNATGNGGGSSLHAVEGGNGGHGGGICNSGVLTLDHASVVDNVAGSGADTSFFGGYGGNGGSGGGVYNEASLTSLSSVIAGNRAGNGGRGGEGGDGGSGGGVYSSSTLDLVDSTVDWNAAGHAGDGWWLGGTGGSGGGIYSSSILTVTNSTMIGNECGHGGGGNAGYGAFGGDGGGIYANGTVVVTNTVVASNTTGRGGGGDYGSGGGKGGGIYNSGLLTLSNSSIGGNATGDGAYSHWGPYLNFGGGGGGIYNGGILELSKSTISDNTTGDGGADPYNEGSDGGGGGGIYNGGVLTVTDCTISNNTTGDGSEGERGNSGSGGGIRNLQTMELRNSTIFGNTAGIIEIDGIGGGVYTSGMLTVGNTILAGNVDVSGPNDCYQGGGTLQSLGHNLAEAVGVCVLDAVGDLTGIDPLLGPLGDSGGPTFTHALLPGSPAIDKGSCEGSLADQRGFPRPVDLAGIANADDGCDIGAFECQGSFIAYLPLIVH